MKKLVFALLMASFIATPHAFADSDKPKCPCFNFEQLSATMQNHMDYCEYELSQDELYAEWRNPVESKTNIYLFTVGPYDGAWECSILQNDKIRKWEYIPEAYDALKCHDVLQRLAINGICSVD
jgi:hypothetical protein